MLCLKVYIFTNENSSWYPWRYALHKSQIEPDHPKDRGYDLETGQI